MRSTRRGKAPCAIAWSKITASATGARDNEGDEWRVTRAATPVTRHKRRSTRLIKRFAKQRLSLGNLSQPLGGQARVLFQVNQQIDHLAERVEHEKVEHSDKNRANAAQ